MTRRLTTFWHLVLSFSFASTLALSGLGAADTEAGAGIARNAQPASTAPLAPTICSGSVGKDCASLSDASSSSGRREAQRGSSARPIISTVWAGRRPLPATSDPI